MADQDKDLFNGLEISDEVKSQLEERFNQATNGLKSNKDAVLKEKKDLEEQLKGFKSQLESFSGDKEELDNFRKLFAENEEAKLISEGKFDEVKNKLLSNHQKELENFKNTFNTEKSGYEEKIKSLNNKIYDYMLNEEISKVALADENFDKTDGSLELLRILAKQNFTASDEGFKFKDESKLDKDGNPYSFGSWFNTDVKQKYSQLFKGVAGAGVHGKDGMKGMDNKAMSNLSMSEFKKLRKEGKI